MSLQHYLPATFLACFSADLNTIPRRKRVLAVGDKQGMNTFCAPASRLAVEKNIYTLKSSADRFFVDATWGAYEKGLAEAINSLINGTITAKAWTRTLVPFVASLLVRGADFKQRFEKRSADLFLERGSDDNTNRARLFELQRILASILAADWHIGEVNGPGELILPDLGYAPSLDPNGNIGIAIPLGPRHVLGIYPKKTRAILKFDGTDWYPIIKRITLDKNSHIDLAQVLAKGAARFIYGATESIVQHYLTLTCFKQTPEPTDLGFLDSIGARVHEFTWHRLVSMLESESIPEPLFSQINYKILKSGWCPPIIVPINLPEFETSLALIGREIVVHLYHVTLDELKSIMLPEISLKTPFIPDGTYFFLPISMGETEDKF